MQKPDQVKVKFRDEILEFELDLEKSVAVIQTDVYGEWIDRIVDVRTNTRITRHVGKMRKGDFGDWKSVGEGVYETRLDYGPGYRIYYAKVGRVIVVLLGGGDKSSQNSDIRKAQELWKELKNEITQI